MRAATKMLFHINVAIHKGSQQSFLTAGQETISVVHLIRKNNDNNDYQCRCSDMMQAEDTKLYTLI